MIKLYIYSLFAIVLALLVTLYLGFPADPGYMLLAFGNYTFETSLFALLVAVALVYLFIKLLQMVWHWINPMQWIRFGKNYRDWRAAKSRSKTLEGLLSFTRGNWQSAFNLLNSARNDNDANVINHLAAAFSAFEIGDRDAWTRQLNEAESRYPAARSTINSLRAQLLFKSDQLEQCLAVLEKLRKSALNDAPLLSLLKEVYIKLEDWQQLDDLLPTLEKHAVVDDEELARIRIRIFMEQLYEAGNIRKSSAEDAAANLARIWKKASGTYREDEKVVKHFVELLLEVRSKSDAAKALEYAIAKRWSEALVTLYGKHDYGCNQQQLLQAEGWLKSRPANAVLLLSLGRICLRNELWGKAKEYYEASIKISPSAEAYGELSRLLKHLGENKASEMYLNKYGELIGDGLSTLHFPTQAITSAKPIV